MLLLDEAEARRAAAAYGISKNGVVGILLHAKKEGWMPSIGDELTALVKRWVSGSLGIWSSESLPKPRNSGPWRTASIAR